MESDNNASAESDKDAEFEDLVDMEFDLHNMKFNRNPEILISLCLKCIIKYFETFMAAYFCTKKEHRRAFEFLQRSYSTYMLEEVSRLYPMVYMQYAEFLFNPHLKAVNIRCERNFDREAILHGLREIGPVIESLNIQLPKSYFPDFQQKNTEFLMELTPIVLNIETLILNTIDINEDILICIRKNCLKLKKLDLSKCKNLNDKHIRSFCDYNGVNGEKFRTKTYTLQHLKLGDNRNHVTAVGVACALKKLKNLVIIEHYDVVKAIYNSYTNDTKSKSREYSETYNLEELKIYNINENTIESIEICASLCPNIKKLTVYEIKSQSQIYALEKFSKPKDVTFGMISKVIDLSHFIKTKGKYLQKLHAWGGSISINNLLKFCPNLQHLDLKTRFLPMDKIETSFPLQYVKYLELKKMNFEELVTVECIKSILLRCPNLENLIFCYSKSITDELVRSIINYPSVKNLKKLAFESSSCTLSAIENFVLNITNLDEVSIKYCYMTDETAEKLQANFRPLLKLFYARPDDFYYDPRYDIHATK